ncbi:hypothetical protein NQ318_001258 [Aromia moschata]|uniref:Uncharacterized protein n=1 Tax=Aromia moschata TaxID=1265417 RepID=A0AAV8ZEV5_9CUCU|nr:hypothetical protein NQ318_001258 [Aromia moschata]
MVTAVLLLKKSTQNQIIRNPDGNTTESRLPAREWGTRVPLRVTRHVLATTDLMTSLLLFFGGLSRGALYHRGWATYDALVGLPLGGAINSLSVLATIGVTVDRVLFLWNPVQCTKPKFCNPTIARKFMTGGLILATLLNIPYCFIFTWTDEGVLTTTDFFDSL